MSYHCGTVVSTIRSAGTARFCFSKRCGFELLKQSASWFSSRSQLCTPPLSANGSGAFLGIARPALPQTSSRRRVVHVVVHERHVSGFAGFARHCGLMGLSGRCFVNGPRGPEPHGPDAFLGNPAHRRPRSASQARKIGKPTFDD